MGRQQWWWPPAGFGAVMVARSAHVKEGGGSARKIHVSMHELERWVSQMVQVTNIFSVR